MKKKELSEIAKQMAKKGGKTTLKRHGKEHYKEMAAERWSRRDKAKK